MHGSIPVVVGQRIRQARTARNLSLSDVASRAKISVATLSRVERDKQGIDLGLFLTLCRILQSSPQELLGSAEPGDKLDPLVVRIAALNHAERLRLWRDLTARRLQSRRQRAQRHTQDQVEELLAQLEFLRAEMEAVHSRIRRR
jgi:transcriptional regulator with XRE-family HTH domain